jgi:hypothetical protein
MATTLTPGVRRLPSGDEMALMQQLVGEVKVGVTSSNTPSAQRRALAKSLTYYRQTFDHAKTGMAAAYAWAWHPLFL